MHTASSSSPANLMNEVNKILIAVSFCPLNFLVISDRKNGEAVKCGTV